MNPADVEARVTDLLGQLPVNLISVGLLVALCLRRLVRMERLHWPRVVLLTVLLWVPAFYLFTLTLPSSHTCMPLAAESEGFTIHE
ncbi:MAG: hypothetical protein ABW208_20740 [Pyrinomonadaceae bacterium]